MMQVHFVEPLVRFAATELEGGVWGTKTLGRVSKCGRIVIKLERLGV